MIEWETGVRDPARLAALAQSGLVGTGPEDEFDRLIELAIELVGVPRGCITLVDAEQTTAKSAVGYPEGTTLAAPVELSFCRFVVGTGRPLVVDDADLDPRTAGDPTIKAFQALSWAGYPIEDPEGAVLGTFCLMDSVPHTWSARDLSILATLAKAASSEVALRRWRTEVVRSRAAEASARREVDSIRSDAERRLLVLSDEVRTLVALGDISDHIGRLLLASLDAPGVS